MLIDIFIPQVDTKRLQDVRHHPRPRHQPARGVQEEKGGELRKYAQQMWAYTEIG